MKVLHLLHSTAIGGVETASAHLHHALGPASAQAERPLTYRVGVMAAGPVGGSAFEADVVGHGLNDPRSVLTLLVAALRGRPDVLVSSLWRTVAVGAVVKFLAPRTRWAIWVHSPSYTHRVDRLVHRLALPRADAVFCDAESTRRALVDGELARGVRSDQVRIVRPEALPLPVPLDAEPFRAPRADEPLRMAFWGRLAASKRVDLAIDLVAELRAIRPGGAELVVIGPDGGAEPDLQERVARLGLQRWVHFTGPADRARIAHLVTDCHAFVQLSEFEGFAMSAHEAMAMGMVSVLTPVGELVDDAVDGVDALLHRGDLVTTARRLTDLAADPAAFDAMRHAAAASAGRGFVDEFVDAVRGIGRGDAR